MNTVGSFRDRYLNGVLTTSTLKPFHRIIFFFSLVLVGLEKRRGVTCLDSFLGNLHKWTFSKALNDQFLFIIVYSISKMIIKRKERHRIPGPRIPSILLIFSSTIYRARDRFFYELFFSIIAGQGHWRGVDNSSAARSDT